MVRIRLKRIGSKGKPFYRIVVADQRAPRDGKYIDLIGTYDPHQDPPEITIDEEKITKWISCKTSHYLISFKYAKAPVF